MRLSLHPGTPFSLGTIVSEEGVNFAFYAPSWPTAFLHLFHEEERLPFFSTPLHHKTGAIWHIFIEGLVPPFAYAFQQTSLSPLLLDPYAKALRAPRLWAEEALYSPLSLCPSPTHFDWEGTCKPQHPQEEWILYEMHLRGFTIHPSSLVVHKGTFLGLAEKIPHLVSLGVNAIELLPVFEFNERETKNRDPITGKRLTNFWGYSSMHFFSLMRRYADQDTILEFKTMVRELHKNNIAVVLDVAYNHTGEGGKLEDGGSVLSFKGFDPSTYYLLTPEGDYYNFAGTGNTMNCNNPLTSQFIVDSLVYFAKEMQVDGFRFDLASILTRGEEGCVLQDPPLLRDIENHPDLQDVSLIAEAWDAGGLYQVGSFPGSARWSEWNGRYRDTVRRFLKGTKGQAGAFAQALCGSQDLYASYSPLRSINFVTAHDGYTLYDLVSYQEKHNEANGEDNKDGTDQHESWNCGVEGETTEEDILLLRARQRKNFATALILSLGIPMLLMGDEYGHTRKGNNNPYCQDNDLNWFLWSLCEKRQEDVRFFKCLIRLRKQKKSLFCRSQFLSPSDVTWHNSDWGPESSYVAYILKDPQEGKDCFIAFHAGHEPLSLALPEGQWRLILNTSLPPPHDFIEEEANRHLLASPYLLPPYTALVAELSSS